MEEINSLQKGNAEDVYRKLLCAQDLQTLARFKTHRSAQMLYPDAPIYPDFFNHNLLVPGRVIKSVKGKSALARAFNFQLMKLTFEIQINDIDYVEVMKAVIFDPNLLVEEGDMTSPISGRTHTDRQYKRIIADFMELMAVQSIPNSQFLLMEYPVVDQAFSYVIDTLISKFYTGPTNTTSLLEWLSQIFSLTVERHGKCYKFEQSDIFLYEQTQDEYYLAYLNQMAEVSDYSESTRFDRINSRQHESVSPQIAEDIQDDIQFRLATDKYRNSAQIPVQRAKIETEGESSGEDFGKDKGKMKQNMRKTFSNEFMREFVKEVDQSIQKDKADRSKIGSLLDIMSSDPMSDPSSKDRTPQITSSRHFQQEERKVPLTTRTAELDNNTSRSFDEPIKPIYVEDNGDQTPHFTAQNNEHHNPFAKKYSQKYMTNFYAKNDDYGYEPPNFGSKFGLNDSSNSFKANYDIKVNEPYIPLERDTSQFSFGKLSDSLDHLKAKKQQNTSFAYHYDLPRQEPYQPTYQNESYTTSLPKPWETAKPWEKSKPWQSYEAKEKPKYDFSADLNTPIDQLKYFKSQSISTLNQPKEDDDLIYRPIPKLKTPSQTKIRVFDEHNPDDTRGTIYRQFTDTKVLDVMTSFARMKTNTIRQKYRGMHKKDLYRGY